MWALNALTLRSQKKLPATMALYGLRSHAYFFFCALKVCIYISFSVPQTPHWAGDCALNFGVHYFVVRKLELVSLRAPHASRVARSVPRIEELILTGCHGVVNEELHELAVELPALRRIVLRKCNGPAVAVVCMHHVCPPYPESGDLLGLFSGATIFRSRVTHASCCHGSLIRLHTSSGGRNCWHMRRTSAEERLDSRSS